MSRFRTVRIFGIPFVDDILAEFLEMLGMVALLTIMVPAILVILVLSFLLSLAVSIPLPALFDLVGIAPGTSRTIAGTIGIGGGLVLTFLGTVRLYRRLERVVNLLTIGEWKKDEELRAEAEKSRRDAARARSGRDHDLTMAELAQMDARLAPRPSAAKRRSAHRNSGK